MSSKDVLTQESTDSHAPEKSETEIAANVSAATADESNLCPNCASQMPREMRFCRHCGYRRGEGVEDYTPTQILPGGQPAPQTSGLRNNDTNNANTPRVAFKDAYGKDAHQTTPPYAPPQQQQQWAANGGFPGFAPTAGGMMQPQQPFAPHNIGLQTNQLQGSKARCKKNMPWLIWLIILVTVLSIGGGAFSALTGVRDGKQTAASAPTSYLGVSDFSDADGNAGAMIDSVSPPDSPADKAGLVGGDIITRYNNQPVKDEDDAREMIKQTPIGATVVIDYIRDGATRQAQLTTISSKEGENLSRAFARRDKGFLGSNGDFERVFVPQLNIHGVKVDGFYKNRPGYIAGLRDEDIIIEFDGAPIRTEDELNARIDRAIPDSTVKVVIVRGGERKEILVKIGVDD